MALKIGICGLNFGDRFVPFFQRHPLAGEVVIADTDERRRDRTMRKHGVRTAYRTFEELLASDVDAVGIFTQRWLHARQAVQALRAGKHVLCAVPAGITVEEVEELVATVRDTGLTFMLAETSYYYPSALYCRERFARGDFGRFVYAEGEYIHDMSHRFYESYSESNGEHWKRYASFPPMLYASHSVSMILSVTGAHMTSVSCLGVNDDGTDGVFLEDVSEWGNAQSNQTALFRTSDGGIARVNEFRKIGWTETPKQASVRLSVFGTLGSFEEQNEMKFWNTVRGHTEDVTSALLVDGYDLRVEDRDGHPTGDIVRDHHSGYASVHPRQRVPEPLLALRNGHEGSHAFLTDDFVRACTTGALPPLHAWAAARYTLPGIAAWESARRDGETIRIPDLGDAPAASNRIDPLTGDVTPA